MYIITNANNLAHTLNGTKIDVLVKLKINAVIVWMQFIQCVLRRSIRIEAQLVNMLKK